MKRRPSIDFMSEKTAAHHTSALHLKNFANTTLDLGEKKGRWAQFSESKYGLVAVAFHQRRAAAIRSAVVIPDVPNPKDPSQMDPWSERDIAGLDVGAQVQTRSAEAACSRVHWQSFETTF